MSESSGWWFAPSTIVADPQAFAKTVGAEPVSDFGLAQGIALGLQAAGQGFSAYQGWEQMQQQEKQLKLQQQQFQAQLELARAGLTAEAVGLRSAAASGISGTQFAIGIGVAGVGAFALYKLFGGDDRRRRG